MDVLCHGDGRLTVTFSLTAFLERVCICLSTGELMYNVT